MAVVFGAEVEMFFESLERRILLSAGWGVGAVDETLPLHRPLVEMVVGDTPPVLCRGDSGSTIDLLSSAEALPIPLPTGTTAFTAATPNSISHQAGLDVVLIDNSLNDRELLFQSVDGKSVVIEYNSLFDTSTQVLNRVIATAAGRHEAIGSLTILSHGNPGEFTLGNQWITGNTVGEQQAVWRELGKVFAPGGNIYVFGCNTGDPSGGGQVLLNHLAAWTGADVFASNDITGAGGDWTLEVASVGAQQELAAGLAVPLDFQELAGYRWFLAGPPSLTTTVTALSYTENNKTQVDSGLTVSGGDADDTGATVTISAGYVNGQDVLAFTNQSGITGSWNASTGVLTLSGTATRANYQTALRSVTYTNTSDAPNTATRTVSFQITDAAGKTSSAATRNITVTAVNDSPVFGTGGNGIVTTPVGSGADTASTLAVQADGKLLAAGGGSGDFGLARYSADGFLDTTFSGDGVLTTAISPNTDIAYSMAIQADGKIVAAGYSYNGSNDDFALVRYNSDGSLDTTFSGDGIVTTGFGGSSADQVKSVAIQADGKIVVAGYSNLGGTNDFALARYNTDGSLDTSFSGDGLLTTAIGTGADAAYGMAIQADGKIVAAGYSYNGSNYDFALVRYNTDGSLDTTFSGDGIVTTGFGGSSADQVQSMAIQADGKIVVGGSSNLSGSDDFAVARYNTDGSLDITFSGDGLLTTDCGGVLDQLKSIAIQSDGKIVAVGNSMSASLVYDIALARYNTDGSLDTTFSGDGKLTTNLGTASDSVNAVAIQSSGKIVAAGSIPVAGNTDFVLVRYASDGEFDTSWGSMNCLDDTPTFIQGGGAVVFDDDVQVLDAELAAAGNYAGATLTIVRNGGTNADDVYGHSGALSALTEGGNLVLSGVTIGTVTTNSGGTLVLTFNASATQSYVNSTLQSITYANSSGTPPASVKVDWTFNDNNTGAQGTGGALGATGSITVTISAASNTAPVLDDTKNPALTAENEDSGAPSGAVGTLVSGLVDFASPSGQVDNVTDADSGALLGIAVTAADTTNGTWYYSTDNGTNWNALGAVTDTNARLLAADGSTRLYFQPDANYNGLIAGAITFRAWDQTSGSNGALTDTSTNGGTTAYSSATDTASLAINAVNDAPVVTPTGSTVNYTEGDGPVTVDDGLTISDADDTNLEGATISITNF
ncbi:MAG: DUF4347 domain-containing protein, partial [Phycisphaerae bacterium]|nr:DUF4347 domain-containing protein [Phycisphaerae bacterium]